MSSHEDNAVVLLRFRRDDKLMCNVLWKGRCLIVDTHDEAFASGFARKWYRNEPTAKRLLFRNGDTGAECVMDVKEKGDER